MCLYNIIVFTAMVIVLLNTALSDCEATVQTMYVHCGACFFNKLNGVIFLCVFHLFCLTNSIALLPI